MNCPVCGNGQLKRETRLVSFTYRGVTIEAEQPGDWCQTCGEGILSADDMATTTKMRHDAIDVAALDR